MRVRAKLTLRNAKMLAAREQMGLSQADLARLSGVRIDRVAKMERFDFAHKSALQDAEEVAIILGIPRCDILPDELLGQVVASSHIRFVDMDPRRLEHLASRALPPPQDSVDAADLAEYSRRVIRDALKTLRYTEREIIKLRYGLGDGHIYTTEEVGHMFKVTRERIRQIEAKAIAKLKQPRRAALLLEALD